MQKSKSQFKIQNIILAGIFIFRLFCFGQAAQANTNYLVISEVMHGKMGCASCEFIEIYNTTDQDIDLKNLPNQGGELKIKFISSTGSISNRTITWNNNIIPKQKYFLFVSSAYSDLTSRADATFSASLTQASGLIIANSSSAIEQIQPLGIELDQSLEKDFSTNQFRPQPQPNPQNSFYEPQSPPPGPVCGNEILEANEICDDGNTIDNDGCSALCQVEQSSGGGEGNNPAPVIKIPPEPLYQVQPSDVVINEIFPEPNAQKGETEWIELYNRTKHSFDLADWIIEDNTQRSQSLAGLTIPAYNFLLITKGEHFNFTLNNGGDILILKKANNIIDQIAYGDFEHGNVADNAPRPGLSKSIGRNTGKADTDNDKKDFFITEKPTPRENNILQSLVYLANPDNKGEEWTNEQASGYKVFISEIFPNSSGQDKDKEWLEIYNKGDEPVNLANWQLIGGLNYSKKYTFPENSKILAKSYIVLKDSDLKFTLRNKSENILLIDGQGKTIDKIFYQDAPEEMSLVRNSAGEIMWNATPTPGKENLFINPDDLDEEETEGTDGQSIKNPTTLDYKQEELISGDYKYAETAEFRDLKNGSRAETRGIVIVQPGILNSQTFYINGLAIYSYYKNFPKLEIGDEISVRGVKSTYSGAPRLKISAVADIKILGRQKKVSPVDLNNNEIDESLLGRLVKILGMVIERTGNNLYLATEDSEILVDLSLLKNLKKSLIKEKGEIVATGILMSRGGDLLVKPFNEKQLEIKDEKQLELEVEPFLNLNFRQSDLSLSDSELSSEQSGTYSNNRKTAKYLTFSAASLALVSLLVFLLRFKLF